MGEFRQIVNGYMEVDKRLSVTASLYKCVSVSKTRISIIIASQESVVGVDERPTTSPAEKVIVLAYQ